MPYAIVALGANLGDARANIRRALAALERFSASPLQVSSLWETSPVDCPPGSPMFLNAVAMLESKTGETAQSLLARLQSLERQIGRQPKKIHNEARVIDLDLIAFGEVVLQSPELVLPHPRAHLRRFVLEPLNQLAPDLVMPGQKKTVEQLLRGLRSCQAGQGQLTCRADEAESVRRRRR